YVAWIEGDTPFQNRVMPVAIDRVFHSFLSARSPHQGEIPPEIHEPVSASEEPGEGCGIHEQDVACPLLIISQAVELRVAG
ncbi:MAG TPA: hypothetical protein VFO00_05340, partial [Vitreimonas sp.]|nr:hypothetical protein [Vitreimonas sp.]